MRILCHAQHLSGVGHFVRMHRIADGLSQVHEVHLVDGGRTVPGLHGAAALHAVPLPTIARAGAELVALGSAASIGSVLRERARILAGAVERIRPDLLLIEHYPFSKWELEGEIVAAIDAARRCQPAVRVLGSLRDVVRQTRHEPVDADAYSERVLAALHSHFDALLVHADPAFTRLETHFAGTSRLPVPIAYTGFVAPLPPVAGHAPSCPGPASGASPSPAGTAKRAPPAHAVLSCGGGADALVFVLDAIAAFRRLAADGAVDGMQLVVFPGAFASPSDRAAIEAAARGGPFRIEPFGAGFDDTLQRSTLSISRAGYNTCIALLRARVRAVLAPDPVMSDQALRARRLAELGLVTLVSADGPPVEQMMAAMRSALASQPPRHRLDLDGAERTRALIETLDAWCPARPARAVAGDRAGSAGSSE